MTPFRSSLPGRLISASIAFALLSGGLIAILGLTPAVWIPWSLLIPIVGCFFGTVLAIASHQWSALAMAVALPVALWPYTMVLMLVTNTHRQYGWALIAGGLCMVALTGVAGLVRFPERRPAARESLAA